MEYVCKDGSIVTATSDGKLESVWCLCSDGVRRNAKRVGVVNNTTFFGSVKVRGHSVSGFIVQTQDGYEFRKNPKGKNCNLLP
jgi:hypothetical protein